MVDEFISLGAVTTHSMPLGIQRQRGEDATVVGGSSATLVSNVLLVGVSIPGKERSWRRQHV